MTTRMGTAETFGTGCGGDLPEAVPEEGLGVGR